MGAGLARWPGYQAGGLRQLLPWSGVPASSGPAWGYMSSTRWGSPEKMRPQGRDGIPGPYTSGQTNQVGGAFPLQPPVAKSIPQEEQWILLQVLS